MEEKQKLDHNQALLVKKVDEEDNKEDKDLEEEAVSFKIGQIIKFHLKTSHPHWNKSPTSIRRIYISNKGNSTKKILRLLIKFMVRLII